MAQKNRSQLNTDVINFITDPEQEQITPAIVRGIFSDIINSSANEANGITTASITGATVKANILSATSIYLNGIDITSLWPGISIAANEIPFGNGSGSLISSDNFVMSGQNPTNQFPAIRVKSHPSEGFNGFRFNTDNGDTQWSEIFRYHFAHNGQLSGTSINLADLFSIKSNNTALGASGKTAISTQVLYVLDESTPGAYGIRVDPLGLRIDTIDRLHTGNTRPFQVGPLTISATAILSGNTDLYNIFATTGNTILSPNQIAFGSSASGLSGVTGFTYNGVSGLTVNSLLRFRESLNAAGWGAIYGPNINSSSNYNFQTNGASVYINGTVDVRLCLNDSYYLLLQSGSVSINPNQNFGVGVTPGAKCDILGSTASVASLRIRTGATVTSPNDGDIWNDGTHLIANIGGRNRELDNYLPTNQIGFGSSISGITGSSSLIWDNANSQLYISSSLTGLRCNISGTWYGTSPDSVGTGIAVKNSVLYIQNAANNSTMFRLAATTSYIVSSLFIGDSTTPTARVDILSSSTTTASIRIRSGATVTSPNDGDIYNNGSGFYGYFEGATTRLDADNTASNVGNGTGLFDSKSGIDLKFRSLSAGSQISLTLQPSREILINGCTVVTNGSNYGLTADTTTDYVHNGGGTDTWTLPVVINNHKYTVTNIGTLALTVNSNAGGNDIYDTATSAAVNTISIGSGGSYKFIGNGTYWIAIKLN